MRRRICSMALAVALALGLALPAHAAGPEAPPYADVGQDQYAYYSQALAFVSEGLMTGAGDGLFRPDEPVTRAMAVQTLFRAAGGQEGAAPAAPFSDVAPSAWYAGAVDWAYASGVVRGAPDGRFHPSQPVSREDLAVLFYRYERTRNPELQVNYGPASALPDYEGVSAYAKDAVAWAYDRTLLDAYGMDEGIHPRDPEPRLMLALTLYRYLVPQEPPLAIDPEKVSQIDLYSLTGGQAQVTGREDVEDLTAMLNGFLPVASSPWTPVPPEDGGQERRFWDIHSQDPDLDGMKLYAGGLELIVEKDGLWTAYQTSRAHAIDFEALNDLAEAYPQKPRRLYQIDPALVESVTLTLPVRNYEDPAPTVELTAREDVERAVALLNGFEAQETAWPDHHPEYVAGALHSADPDLDGLSWRVDQNDCLTAAFHGVELLHSTTAVRPHPPEEGEPGLWERLRAFFPDVPMD